MSPTSRCLKYLRELGYQAEKVEHWNSFAKRRIDLFQCIDIVAVKAGCPILGIQACAHGDLAKRVKKCVEHGQGWMAAGGQLQAWAWRKLKGKRQQVLDRREIPRTSDD